VVIVMCGLPGAGKSAVADGLARELGAPVLSVDPLEASLWRGRSGVSCRQT
jgi:predicted kinase